MEYNTPITCFAENHLSIGLYSSPCYFLCIYWFVYQHCRLIFDAFGMRRTTSLIIYNSISYGWNCQKTQRRRSLSWYHRTTQGMTREYIRDGTRHQRTQGGSWENRYWSHESPLYWSYESHSCGSRIHQKWFPEKNRITHKNKEFFWREIEQKKSDFSKTRISRQKYFFEMSFLMWKWLRTKCF